MTNKLVVDRRFLDVAKKKWGNRYEILPSFCVENLAAPVTAHPDMSIIRVNDVFVAEKTAFSYYKKLLPHNKVIEGKTALSSNYPKDIAYNVLIFENVAIANFKHTDSVLKNELLKNGIKLIQANQGYAKCSAVTFPGGIITADETIYKAAYNEGIDVLKILPGGVRLQGYEYGFIGGASGFADGKLLFFGDITKHQNYKEICEFVKSKNFDIDYIEGFPLTDVGTVISIDE